jgi:uncharacterized membrane protein YphA (DoxX/SURF4 family)
MTIDRQRGWVVVFARLALGFIFFMAGLWKVFQLGPSLSLTLAATLFRGWRCCSSFSGVREN